MQELIHILEPFAEATDLTQGDKTISISCVVPVILSPNKFIAEQAEKGGHLSGIVTNLAQGLHDRYRGVYSRLKIIPLCWHK